MSKKITKRVAPKVRTRKNTLVNASALTANAKALQVMAAEAANAWNVWYTADKAENEAKATKARTTVSLTTKRQALATLILTTYRLYKAQLVTKGNKKYVDKKTPAALAVAKAETTYKNKVLQDDYKLASRWYSDARQMACDVLPRKSVTKVTATAPLSTLRAKSKSSKVENTVEKQTTHAFAATLNYINMGPKHAEGTPLREAFDKMCEFVLPCVKARAERQVKKDKHGKRTAKKATRKARKS